MLCDGLCSEIWKLMLRDGVCTVRYENLCCVMGYVL